jgi:hypothetical protein
METGIDPRNVRTRFGLFENFKYPNPAIAADRDEAELCAAGDEVRSTVVDGQNGHARHH